MRILDFSDNFTSATEPVIGIVTANALNNFSNDAAYVTYKGSPAVQGNIYLRSSDSKIRYYNGTDWVTVVSEDASGNITVTNNLTVTGDLVVSGTTTTLNVQTLDVEDHNITVNALGDDASAEGSGLTVDRTGTNGSLIYADAVASKFKIGAAGAEKEVVDISSTQSLSNKTFGDAITATQIATPATPSAGTNKIYAKADGNFYNLNSSGIESPIGSGSGGAKNYLGSVNGINGNGNFELGSTSKWSLAHTTLSSLVPNQASGSWTAASANLAISAVTSGKLAGSYSLQAQQSTAASVAGDMLVSDAFTIDKEDQAKPMTFKYYYSATANSSNLNFSGTSATTLQTYLYDVTNGAWIQPAGVYGMTQGSGVGYVTGTFQTTSNSTQYRLAVVNVNASAGIFTMLFDDFELGPQTAPIGAVVTDWVTFTPTGTWTTNTTYAGKYRRVGDSAEFAVNISLAGAPNAAQLQLNIPFGLSIDTTKILTSNPDLDSKFGFVRVLDGGTLAYAGGTVGYASPTSLNVYVQYTAGTYANPTAITQAVPFTFGSGDGVSAIFSVPISGWSSNVQMSNDTDTRVVSFQASRNGSNQTGINPNGSAVKLLFNSVAAGTDKDSNGTYDTTNSRYVVGVTGRYHFDAVFDIASTNVLNNIYIPLVYKNGAEIGRGALITAATGAGFGMQINSSFDAIAGDYFEIYLYGVGNNSASTLTMFGTGNRSYFSGFRLSGPATIAASESVSALYTGNPATGTLTNSYNTTTFGTKVKDTHLAYSGGVYTVPASGTYSISAQVIMGGTYSLGTTVAIGIFVNGTIKYVGAMVTAGAVINVYPVVTTNSVPLLAGDLVTIRSYNAGTGLSFGSDPTANYFSITRTGNY